MLKLRPARARKEDRQGKEDCGDRLMKIHTEALANHTQCERLHAGPRQNPHSLEQKERRENESDAPV